jgi:hypothetical protein
MYTGANSGANKLPTKACHKHCTLEESLRCNLLFPRMGPAIHRGPLYVYKEPGLISKLGIEIQGSNRGNAVHIMYLNWHAASLSSRSVASKWHATGHALNSYRASWIVHLFQWSTFIWWLQHTRTLPTAH